MVTPQSPTKTEVLVLLGDRESVGIAGGPNDWDLWLCFRGTLREVTFFVDRPIRFPQFHENDASTFFNGDIDTLSNRADRLYSYEKKWHIEGKTTKWMTGYYFVMEYDPQTRKGSVTFSR